MSSLPAYTGLLGRTWHYVFRFVCGAILFFLIAPIIVIIPLSFNAESYFTFTDAMLRLDPDAFSLKWYREILVTANRPDSMAGEWAFAARNSIVIAIFATALATTLGTLAALGLCRPEMPLRGPIMALLISPIIVPIVITAAGMFIFYSNFKLTYNHFGVIIAHAALGTPFVVITVTATLIGFDQMYARASASLGARPVYTFFKVTLPLIAPGVISGALFAFITSFDEVVVVLFLGGKDQTTIPMQMWGGIRQEITLSILAVATILIVISTLLLTAIELLRRRGERLRGIRPS